MASTSTARSSSSTARRPRAAQADLAPTGIAKLCAAAGRALGRLVGAFRYLAAKAKHLARARTVAIDRDPLAAERVGELVRPPDVGRRRVVRKVDRLRDRLVDVPL